ncbi:hypothetical protein [Elizabethkingia anophelis]|nr:hypothetical protein [Elizabethkingia anophelis]
MNESIQLIVFGVFVFLRILTFLISFRHAYLLRLSGNEGHGIFLSCVLMLVHLLYYVVVYHDMTESMPGRDIEELFYLGLVFLLFSYFVQFFIIYHIREAWSVLIYIAPRIGMDYSVILSRPRQRYYLYYTGLELLGISMVCGSLSSVIYVFPIYVLLQLFRIYYEKKLKDGLYLKERQIL